MHHEAQSASDGDSDIPFVISHSCPDPGFTQVTIQSKWSPSCHLLVPAMLGDSVRFDVIPSPSKFQLFYHPIIPSCLRRVSSPQTFRLKNKLSFFQAACSITHTSGECLPVRRMCQWFRSRLLQCSDTMHPVVRSVVKSSPQTRDETTRVMNVRWRT